MSAIYGKIISWILLCDENVSGLPVQATPPVGYGIK